MAGFTAKKPFLADKNDTHFPTRQLLQGYSTFVQSEFHMMQKTNKLLAEILEQNDFIKRRID